MPEITFCVVPFEPSPIYAGRLGEGSKTGCGEEGGVGISLSMMSCCAPVLCVQNVDCEWPEGEDGEVACDCCGGIGRWMETVGCWMSG